MATAQRRYILSPPQGPLPAALPRLQSDLSLNDTTLFAVYCFIRNFVGTAPNTPAIIDVKIEQAMDLVKNHLLFTVHEEVEVLKHRISELLARINQLEIENNFLRANASPEVLTALTKRAEEGAIENGNSADIKAIKENSQSVNGNTAAI